MELATRHPVRPATARLKGLPPAILLVPTLIVAGLSALPLVYLAVRALGVDPADLPQTVGARTLEIMGASLMLTAGVAGGATAPGHGPV